MKLGIIDLGTNSVRFDVYEVSARRKPRKVYREKLMIRLGDTVFHTGIIERAAMQRAISAFNGFRKVVKLLDVERVVAVGTSALREAKNARQLVTQIEKRTGIRIHIISGAREAKLIARGIFVNEKKISGRFVTVDIGGGSTELNICSGRTIQRSMSLKLGVARLKDLYLRTQPPRITKTSDPIRELREFIRLQLRAFFRGKRVPKVDTLIGSSGTVRAFAVLQEKAKGTKKLVTLAFLKQTVQQMQGMSRAELLRVPGMDEKRADLMLAGGIVLEEILEFFHAKKVRVSEFSLREGLFDEELKKLQKSLSKNLPKKSKNLNRASAKLLTTTPSPRHLKAVLQRHFAAKSRRIKVRVGKRKVRVRIQGKEWFQSASFLREEGKDFFARAFGRS